MVVLYPVAQRIARVSVKKIGRRLTSFTKGGFFWRKKGGKEEVATILFGMQLGKEVVKEEEKSNDTIYYLTKCYFTIPSKILGIQKT